MPTGTENHTWGVIVTSWASLPDPLTRVMQCGVIRFQRAIYYRAIISGMPKHIRCSTCIASHSYVCALCTLELFVVLVMNVVRQWTYYNDITWASCHDVSNHRQLDSAFIGLFRLTTKKYKSPTSVTLCEWKPPVTKESVMREAFPADTWRKNIVIITSKRRRVLT